MYWLNCCWGKNHSLTTSSWKLWPFSQYFQYRMKGSGWPFITNANIVANQIEANIQICISAFAWAQIRRTIEYHLFSATWDGETAYYDELTSHQNHPYIHSNIKSFSTSISRDSIRIRKIQWQTTTDEYEPFK